VRAGERRTPVRFLPFGFEGGRGGAAGTVGDLAVQASLVEPVDIGEGGELDVLQPGPRALGVDELPLVEPVEALGHGVVEAVALRADRHDDVVLVEALTVADSEVLTG